MLKLYEITGQIRDLLETGWDDETGEMLPALAQSLAEKASEHGQHARSAACQLLRSTQGPSGGIRCSWAKGAKGSPGTQAHQVSH